MCEFHLFFFPSNLKGRNYQYEWYFSNNKILNDKAPSQSTRNKCD